MSGLKQSEELRPGGVVVRVEEDRLRTGGWRTG